MKKTITAEQQEKLLAGRQAAKARRELDAETGAPQAATDDAVSQQHAEIALQLDAVHDDIIVARKLFAQLERSCASEKWSAAAGFASALSGVFASVSRRIEAQAARAAGALAVASAVRGSARKAQEEG